MAIWSLQRECTEVCVYVWPTLHTLSPTHPIFFTEEGAVRASAISQPPRAIPEASIFPRSLQTSTTSYKMLSLQRFSRGPLLRSLTRSERVPLYRFYARTPAVCQDEATKTVKKKRKKYKDPEKVRLAREYNERRAAYNRQVKQLRKQYAEEYAKQQAAEKAAREAKQRELTRKKLERRRLKNIRTAQNAIKEEERRKKREVEFQRHLDEVQARREARLQLYTAARQKIVDELEEEAPLWLTTPEEIEKAFTHEAEQLLWARPGGVLGAPNPSLDTHFWAQETKTWHVTKTYRTQKEILLEQYLEEAYNDANIDPEFWTPEKLLEVEELETRARLRAEVKRTGRLELIRKQNQILAEQYHVEEGDIPKKVPAPNLKFLANEQALEQEGVKVLMSDPTRFFVFKDSQGERVKQDLTCRELAHPDEMKNIRDEDGVVVATADQYTDDSVENDEEYSGPAKGAPVDIRRSNAKELPQPLGKPPPFDDRSERDKKLQDREDKLLAAATAEEYEEAEILVEDTEDDAGFEEADDEGVDDQFKEFDDDEEWLKGLGVDSEEYEEFRSVPPAFRHTKEDIDWVITKLKGEQDSQLGVLGKDIRTMQEEMAMDLDRSGITLPEDSLEKIVMGMSDKELLALSDIDELYVLAEEETGGMSREEFSEFAEVVKDRVPTLTEDQLWTLMQREREAE